MVEKFCTYITNKIRRKMPEIDDERAEVINYGIQLIVGEIPKLVFIIAIAFIFKMGWLLLFAYFTLLPYKASSGGFHCKTHIGCFISTCVMYYGVILLSKHLYIEQIYKYILIFCVWIFGIIMINKYAPADTENVPIISKKERKKKKTLSYIFLTLNLIIALFLPNMVLSNILIVSSFIQTLTITKVAYKLTNNKYSYEVECL